MKRGISILILVFAMIPSILSLFKPGYFSMHDDLQVMRIYELERCFKDGQIPCRWSPDMTLGYGQAMFNFYSALPYYLGAFIRMSVPLSIIATVKTLFLISILLSGIGMYLLAREFWGDLGGIVAGVFYTYAPYHALDIYVRGALAESFALAILPFLWYSFYRLIKEEGFVNVILTSFVLSLLLTTHNISSMIYAPFTILWVIYLIVRFKNWIGLRDVIVSGILGIGLAGFFIIPAISEVSLTQANLFRSDYFDYFAHFVSLKQLFFERSWGFGASTFGPNDELSFQIGYLHWVLGVILFFIGVGWTRNGKKRKSGILLIILLLLSGVSAFMTHQRSYFIWQYISELAFVQFPWRFLGLTIFFLSFASGAITKLNRIFAFHTLFILSLLVIILNLGYFIPERFFRQETDSTKLSGVLFENQQKAGPLDYLPITVKEVPKEIAPRLPQVIEGAGETRNFSYQTNRFFFDANIYSKADVEIPIIYFPNWKIVSNQKEINYRLDQDNGTIIINLDQGQYIIQGRFVNTKVRDVGNLLTILSASLILIGYVLRVNNKRFLWY